MAIGLYSSALLSSRKYCGRVGYCVARYSSTSLHIHPSSAINYVDISPRWVVYEQVLTTSRTFLINATPVEHDWVLEALQSRRVAFCQVPLSCPM